MHDDDATLHYVHRHFWSIGTLAEAIGSSPEHTLSLIDAGCAPGAIYVRGPQGWWSALDRRTKPRPDGVTLYSPGAAWPLRQAMLAERRGMKPAVAAKANETRFVADFITELARAEDAALAFPECFETGEMSTATAGLTARREWAGWIGGGYGVCLRVFTAETCILKETLAATIKGRLGLADYDASRVLADCERLAGVMLPFAPWQRPNGTPGKTIDRLLLLEGLGSDARYPTTLSEHARTEHSIR